MYGLKFKTFLFCYSYRCVSTDDNKKVQNNPFSPTLTKLSIETVDTFSDKRQHKPSPSLTLSFILKLSACFEAYCK